MTDSLFNLGFWTRSMGVGIALILTFFSPLAAQPTANEDTVLIRNVQLLDFDGPAPRVREHMTVLVRDGIIANISASVELMDVGDAHILDGAGQTLMPGLIDMHVHVWDEAELGAYLAYGVTTVRNLAGMPLHLELQERIDAGELAGPHLVTSGPILNGTGPNTQPNHMIVETPEEASAAVRWQHESGYRRIKIYSNLNRDAYEAILAEAALLGMPITGHTPEGPRETGIPGERPFLISFEDILDDGMETIEHVESIVWHGLRDRMDEDAGRALARRIAEAGVAVDPTLLAFANLQRVAASSGAYLQRPGTDMLNPFIRQMEASMDERWSAEDAADATTRLDFYQRFTRMLDDAGVPIVAGSDAGIFVNIPGVSLHDELDLLIEAGLSPETVLRAATVTAAEILGNDAATARIAIGQRADLILVNGDPLSDLTVMRNPVLVVVAGRIFTPSDLAALRDSAVQTDALRTQANVFRALEAQGTSLPAE